MRLSVWLTQRVMIHIGVVLPHPAVCLMQGAELPAEAVSGLPGGAGDPAGVGERGASSADHQPGYQLLLWPVGIFGLVKMKCESSEQHLYSASSVAVIAFMSCVAPPVFQRSVWKQLWPGCGGLPPENSAPQHGHVRAVQPIWALPEAAAVPAQSTTAFRRWAQLHQPYLCLMFSAKKLRWLPIISLKGKRH